jgi:hypothetical protein
MKAIAAAVTAGVGLLTLVTPVGAKPLEKEHYSESFTDTFTDTDCGAPITVEYTGDFAGTFMLRQTPQGDLPLFFDNYSGVETYTANGKTAVVTHQGMVKDQRITHVEGNVYRIVAIETGRPVVVFGPDGRRLIFDAGHIRYDFMIDTLGDDNPENDVFLSEEDPVVNGPHPIFFGVRDFCDLLDLIR